MQAGQGQVLELILEDGCRHVRLACPANLVPFPGQYILASDGSDLQLPVPLFYTDFAPRGGRTGSGQHFIAAPAPDSWNPGLALHLRGPLGRGFRLSLSARRVGLVAFDDSAARLKGLIQPALDQEAAVVLVCARAPENLPDDVEVQPVSALPEIVEWADYVAFDVGRENLNLLKERVIQWNWTPGAAEGQVLVRTPVPCGGLADCGVCAVRLGSDWKLACKEGPVFDWKEPG